MRADSGLQSWRKRKEKQKKKLGHDYFFKEIKVLKEYFSYFKAIKCQICLSSRLQFWSAFNELFIPIELSNQNILYTKFTNTEL